PEPGRCRAPLHKPARALLVHNQAHADGAVGFMTIQLQQARALLVVTRQRDTPAGLLETAQFLLIVPAFTLNGGTARAAMQPVTQARHRNRAAQDLLNQRIRMGRYFLTAIRALQQGLTWQHPD